MTDALISLSTVDVGRKRPTEGHRVPWRLASNPAPGNQIKTDPLEKKVRLKWRSKVRPSGAEIQERGRLAVFQFSEGFAERLSKQLKTRRRRVARVLRCSSNKVARFAAECEPVAFPAPRSLKFPASRELLAPEDTRVWMATVIFLIKNRTTGLGSVRRE